MSGKITREELHIDLNNELDRKVEIDDNLSISSDKTYSIDKINQLINDVTIDSISANNVIDTPTRAIPSPSQIAQISSNATDINSIEQRVITLESNPTTDEKVKLNSTSESKFLAEWLDNDTIQIDNNLVTATKLKDMLATIQEINYLQGVTSPIQQQIDSLTSLGNYSTSVPTYADLLLIEDMSPQDMVIVLQDENEENKSTIYIYNGSQWNLSGYFKSGEVRNFTSDPINLQTEVTGLLKDSNIENVKASKVTVVDSAGNFTSTNVEDILAELFQYANSLKNGVTNSIGYPLLSSDTSQQMLNKINALKVLFANNLTQKGIVAYSYNTLESLIEKIMFIPNVEISAGLKRVTKLNIQAPYTHEITLNNPLRVEDVCATVLELVGAVTDVVHYEVNFDNTDASSFDYDPRFVEFDGHMKLKEKHSFSLTKINEIEGDFELYESEEINLDNYIDFRGDVTVKDGSVVIEALPKPQIIKANGDILLNGVDSLDAYIWSVVTSGNGIANIVISFDSGLTYHTYINDEWIEIDVNSTGDMISDGMNKQMVDSLTNSDLVELRGESNFLRHAYVLARDSFSDEAYNDMLQIKVTMQGRNEIADTSKYSYSYDQSTKRFTFNFKNSGTYSITYVDGA